MEGVILKSDILALISHGLIEFPVGRDDKVEDSWIKLESARYSQDKWN
jgi:hypothetical protein